MQQTYELMVLLHPDLEIDVETPIKKIEGLVSAVGGKITKRDNWGKKRLAYKIKRQEFAVYVYFELRLEPTQVRQLENTILITEEVLRHILVVHEENERAVRKETEDNKQPAEAAAKEGE